MPVDDLMHGLKELREAEEGYELAELYYTGENEELFASPRMARALRAYEARYRLRLAKVPVDAITDRLEIAAVSIVSDEPLKPPIGDDDDDDGPADEDEAVGSHDPELSQLLEDMRDDNDMENEEDTIHERASMFGDAYLIASPAEDDDGERTIELFYNSPFEVRICYDESGRHKLYAVKLWEETDAQNLKYLRATVFYADAIEEYVTKTGSKGDQKGDWEPFGAGSPRLDEDGNALTVPALHPVSGQPIYDPDSGEPVMVEDIEEGVYWHDFGEIPVFHFRNRRPYGTPEHEAAYGPQDMIDKLTITHMATIDFQGFQQRYALMDPQAAQAGEGSDWPDDDASAATESTSDPKLKAGPGELWWLEGVKAVGQFDPADAAAFLDPLDRYIRGMSTVTQTPFHLFDPTGTPGAGESRRSSESGQTRKVRRRQRQYGATWKEVYGFAMWWITGQDVRDRMEIQWVPAEQIDPAEAWDLAAKKKGVGLPFVQIMLEHGYSPDAIMEFMRLALEERKQQIELQREAFQATMQENRDDRPNRPNPDTGNPGGSDGGGAGGGAET